MGNGDAHGNSKHNLKSRNYVVRYDKRRKEEKESAREKKLSSFGWLIVEFCTKSTERNGRVNEKKPGAHSSRDEDRKKEHTRKMFKCAIYIRYAQFV